VHNLVLSYLKSTELVQTHQITVKQSFIILFAAPVMLKANVFAVTEYHCSQTLRSHIYVLVLLIIALG
jgi:hypothetical protein